MNNYTSMNDAIEHDDFEAVREYLASGVNVDEKDECGFTSVYQAVIKDSKKILKFLIDSGADISAKDEEGWTPWEYAVIEQRDFEIIKLLTDAGGAEIISKKKYDKLALHHAACMNDVKEIEYLLSQDGMDVDLATDAYGDTPLHVAAYYNKQESHLRLIEVLLENGANVNALNTLELTPFNYLVRNSNIKTVQTFLKFMPADVDLQNQEKDFLIEAIKSENHEIVQFLIDHGFSLNRPNSNYLERTPTFIACIIKNLDLMKCVLRNGGDVYFSQDRYGQTPLDYMFISAHMHPEILTFSIKYFDLNKVAENKDILAGKVSTWKIFLKHCAKLQTLDLPVPSIISETFLKHDGEHKNFFQKCIDELLLAKNSKISESWVTFFNILTNNKKSLKNFAGNQDLIEKFQSIDYQTKFPIYGSEMIKKFSKGIKRRKFFDRSSMLLSDCLKILNPTHLIIRDVLDCLSTKDLIKFYGERNFKKRKNLC